MGIAKKTFSVLMLVFFVTALAGAASACSWCGHKDCREEYKCEYKYKYNYDSYKCGCDDHSYHKYCDNDCGCGYKDHGYKHDGYKHHGYNKYNDCEDDEWDH